MKNYEADEHVPVEAGTKEVSIRQETDNLQEELEQLLIISLGIHDEEQKHIDSKPYFSQADNGIQFRHEIRVYAGRAPEDPETDAMVVMTMISVNPSEPDQSTEVGLRINLNSGKLVDGVMWMPSDSFTWIKKGRQALVDLAGMTGDGEAARDFFESFAEGKALQALANVYATQVLHTKRMEHWENPQRIVQQGYHQVGDRLYAKAFIPQQGR